MYVLRGGLIVTESDVQEGLDIVIGDDGRIADIGKDLSADSVVDCTNLYIFPGCIDPHVHLQYPQGGNRILSSDCFASGTAAAAAGGTTTIVDFVERSGPDESFEEAFAKRNAEALSPGCFVDWGFHMCATRFPPASCAEEWMQDIKWSIGVGCPTFKVYMAYDGIRLDNGEMQTLVSLMSKVNTRPEKGLVIVHAEDHETTMKQLQSCRDGGRTHPRFHPTTRPAGAEEEAISRILTFANTAGNVPVHVVHVSTVAGAQIVENLSGEVIHSGEVCAHHLVLDESLFSSLDATRAAGLICAPPLRPVAECKGLLQKMQNGSPATLFTVTDHCAFTMAQRLGVRRTPEICKRPVMDSMEIVTERAPGSEDPWFQGPGQPPFFEMPGGVPGIQVRVPLVYDLIVDRGSATKERNQRLCRFVQLTSTNAAKRFGMYPQKGCIGVGSDADFCIVDPRDRRVISASSLLENVDYTPFEGRQVAGWPTHTIVRGVFVVRNRKFVGTVGHGKFVHRKISKFVT